MTKDDVVHFIGNKEGFTHGRNYTVLAGAGDGLPRNDGLLGAYIKSDTLLVVRDDSKQIRHLNFQSGDWIRIHREESTWVPKPEVEVFNPSKHAVC